jgi:hypothetical protein
LVFDMAPARKSRLQDWLEKRDRSNQIAFDAMRPPKRPTEPAMVLEARLNGADPAFGARLRLLIDGQSMERVPWGWSVHPLPPGEHVIEISHDAGAVKRGSRAEARIDLSPEHPVLHLAYQPRAFFVFLRGRITAEPYAPDAAQP